MYNQKSRCPETGRLSRIGNRFHDLAAERKYNSRLPMARLVRSISNRNGHTIDWIMKYRKEELDQLKNLFD